MYSTQKLLLLGLATLLGFCLAELYAQAPVMQYFGDRSVKSRLQSVSASPTATARGIVTIGFDEYIFELDTLGGRLALVQLESRPSLGTSGQTVLVNAADGPFVVDYRGITTPHSSARVQATVLIESNGYVNGAYCAGYEGYRGTVGGYYRVDVEPSGRTTKLFGPIPASHSTTALVSVGLNTSTGLRCSSVENDVGFHEEYIVLGDTILLVDQAPDFAYDQPTFKATTRNLSPPAPVDLSSRLPLLDSFFVRAANPAGLSDAGLIYVEGLRDGLLKRYAVDLLAETTYELTTSTAPTLYRESATSLVYVAKAPDGTSSVERIRQDGSVTALYQTANQVTDVVDFGNATSAILVFEERIGLRIEPYVVASAVTATGNLPHQWAPFGKTTVPNTFHVALLAGDTSAVIVERLTDPLSFNALQSVSQLRNSTTDTLGPYGWQPRSWYIGEERASQLYFTETSDSIEIAHTNIDYDGTNSTTCQQVLAKPHGSAAGRTRVLVNEDGSFVVGYGDPDERLYLFRKHQTGWDTLAMPDEVLLNGEAPSLVVGQLHGDQLVLGLLHDVDPRAGQMSMLILDARSGVMIGSRSLALNSGYRPTLFLDPSQEANPTTYRLLAVGSAQGSTLEATALVYDAAEEDFAQQTLTLNFETEIQLSYYTGLPGSPSSVYCQNNACVEFDFEGHQLVSRDLPLLLPDDHLAEQVIVRGGNIHVLGSLSIVSQLQDRAFYAIRAIDPLVSSTQSTTMVAAFTAYPSPTQGRVTVELSEPLKKFTQATVFDASGRAVQVKSLNAGDTHFQLDLSQVPKGVYAVQIEGRSVRVIVE